MNKKNIATVVLTSLFIFVFALCAVFKPQDAYSQSERRKLEQFPILSLSAIKDQSFFNKFSKYAVDQFPLRESFRTVKALFAYNIYSHKDNNDIYVADGHGAKLEYPLREDSVKQGAGKINYLKENYLQNCKVYCSIIPDKNYFLAAENNYPHIDYNKMMEIFLKNLDDITYINIFDTLEISDYYTTDTHWDQSKILPTAQKIANNMGFIISTEFTEEKLSPFYGVYYGQSALPLKADTITYLTSSYTNKSTAFNYETNKEIPVYTLDKFTGDDPYDIFLDGAAALIEINNPLSETQKELIIFRDSFGSSIAPLFLEAYSKITLIDTRYIEPALLENYIEFTNQDVLFLYNTSVLNNSNMLK